MQEYALKNATGAETDIEVLNHGTGTEFYRPYLNQIIDKKTFSAQN